MTTRVATDVGGTFTDVVTLTIDPASERQEITIGKADTTPPDFERGVLAALAKREVALDRVDYLAHGSTIVINALTERKGVTTGLITTRGFRDSLEIARGNRPDFFNLHYVKPAPFVPRNLRREVGGRLGPDGHEREPLDLDGVPGIVDDFRAAGVEAIAVCLLHAYADPNHEARVVARVRELWPEVSVVASHQVTREWREYERTNTTVLSAYVQPVTAGYLGRLTDAVAGRGFAGRLLVMQSNCGVDSVERAREVPIAMVESGPASGILGAAELGRVIGEPNVLALDIGGTTAKCSLIEDGNVRIMTDYWIERSRESAGYPIMVPVVDLVEIGAGGGSIATVDDFGKLRVGPESAGADPGPAAYGRGGGNATTTDACLALGRINADYFCGGEIEADMDAVGAALDRLATSLGTDRQAAARGVVRLANHNMINALKLVSLNRGHDPRDFTLVAFGGGGGMHAVALAKELGMRRVIVPRAAEVFSAWGMLMGDLRRDFMRTSLLGLEPGNAERLDALLGDVAGEALGYFADEGVAADAVRIVRHGNLRYENQEHTVEVQLPDGPVGAAAVGEIEAAFHEEFERQYTYRLDVPIELVGVHLVAFGDVGRLEPAPLPEAGGSLADAHKGRREVDYADEGIHPADVYRGEDLGAGMSFRGPAIVETAGTTTVVHPGDEVSVDPWGNLVIAVAAPTEVER
ncbi:MAG: hydantoinase/oxoprolinase family protein [Actinobacteria bacterium]|nr:hydantoinase/oxoprolinase family protein [Actinomycetota bacterium]